MSYFKLFPKVDYDINRTGTVQKIVDIYRSVRPLQEFVDSPSLYMKYEIKNGERPDITSQRLYGTPEYYWTFFVVNEFLHDGYKVWPMSQELLLEYLNTEYNGFAITCDPNVTPTSDGGFQTENSIAGKFQLGETLTGGASGCSGTLVRKNIDLNQLIVQNVTLGSGNAAFIGDGNQKETIAGGSTGQEVQSHIVYKYVDAPHHYYINETDVVTGATEKRIYTNERFIDDPSPLDEGNPTTISNLYQPSYATVEGLQNELNIPSERLAKSETALSIVTNREHIQEKNDERSSIRVINPEFIGEFVSEFEKILNK